MCWEHAQSMDHSADSVAALDTDEVSAIALNGVGALGRGWEVRFRRA